jgi:hypothetical protein
LLAVGRCRGVNRNAAHQQHEFPSHHLFTRHPATLVHQITRNAIQPVWLFGRSAILGFPEWVKMRNAR